MTEDDAKAWMAGRVPRETLTGLQQLVDIVCAEAAVQNLIAASTIETIWFRHIVDSAQLLDLAPEQGRWIDLGSGAGFPGLVVGLMSERRVTLTESRAKRVAFLQGAITQLGLEERVDVRAGRLEMLPSEPFDVVSARAFAPLERLLPSAVHLAHENTCWVLPKGRGAQAELDAVRGSWQGSFRVVPSITDPEAAIIVADHVRPARGGRKAGSGR